MKNYRMKIELLSDLCVSDGGVYNSALDIDVCYDSHGLPYIPAKRLRGCLRECAQELKDWGVEISPAKLFGEAGRDTGGASKVRIGNAYIEGADEKKKEIQANKSSIVFHPQNVLNQFTSVRTQTSIDYETGVAEENSLRSMRVVNKGMVFYADVELDDVVKTAFEQCCKVLRHIGMSRTRGLGEIKVSLEKAKVTKASIETFLEDNAECLTYTLFLEEPVICQKLQSGEIKSMDYIDGAKILGMIAQCLRDEKKDYNEFMKAAQLKCTNAYPEWNGTRMTEVPACYYAIKNNKTDFVDKAYEIWKDRKQEEKKETIQLNQMKHCYVADAANEDLQKCSVEIEKRYHHRRPEDKSIGRAVENGTDSDFYQISSIAEGQRFTGYIYAAPDKMKELYEMLQKSALKYIGLSKGAEYGKVRLERLVGIREAQSLTVPEMNVKEKQADKEEDVKKAARYLLVKLEAPTIVYSKNAMCSVDVDDLDAEVRYALFGTEEKEALTLAQKYVTYTSVSGYNITWGCRKPSLDVFDKGTVLLYQVNKEEKFTVPASGFLGERNEEGYGEFSVQMIQNPEDTGTAGYQRCYWKKAKETEEKTTEIRGGSFAKDICDRMFQEYIRVKAAQTAKNMELSEVYKPTVGNLLSMCKENNTAADVRESAKERFGKNGEGKAAKWDAAEKIFEAVKAELFADAGAQTGEKLVTKFSEEYKLAGFSYELDAYWLLYLKSCLLELKYRLRLMQTRNTVGKEEQENE